MRTVKVVLLTVTLTLTSVALAGEKRIRWLNKPWEIRYILFVSNLNGFNSSRNAALKTNANSTINGVEKFALDVAELFQPTTQIAAPTGKPIVTVLLSFDQLGRPHSDSLDIGNWIAKRDTLDALLLVDEDHPTRKPYHLADWSQGIPGDMSFSPAVCAGFDNSRYSDNWILSDVFGGFGCREWTAQLYRWELPYIDVTSYGQDGSFIGEFVGWSRFTDPQKPVIGLQGKTWLCLHECPKGEKPGVIRNIKAWTQKHGFPMPQRPPKQPLYPNSDHLDDIHEFDD